MSLLGKIFVVVVTVLSLVFLGMQSTLYYHSTDWREAHERLLHRHQLAMEKKNADVDGLKGSIQDLEKSRATLDAEKTDLTTRLKAEADKYAELDKNAKLKQQEFDVLNATHQTLQNGMQSKEKELSDSRARIDQLAADLNTARADKETAEAQVARLISQKAALEKDLSEVRKDYSDTKQRLLDMQLVMEELERQGVPVGTLVVNHKPVPPIHGKVAGVKTDVSPALVLLTVGKDDKVEKGFNFTIYRGAVFVGKVVVEKVYADSAGCRVLFTAPGQTIKAGDDVATRLD